MKPVYVRRDYHDLLKLQALRERKKLYQLLEEILSTHYPNVSRAHDRIWPRKNNKQPQEAK